MSGTVAVGAIDTANRHLNEDNIGREGPGVGADRPSTELLVGNSHADSAKTLLPRDDHFLQLDRLELARSRDPRINRERIGKGVDSMKVYERDQDLAIFRKDGAPAVSVTATAYA